MNEERIPLRQRRDLGEIIQAALHLYGQHPLPLVSIAAIVIPLGIASAAFQSAIDDEVAMTLVVIGVGVLQFVANVVASAGIVAALQSGDAGEPVEFAAACDAAFARLGTLIGATLRALGIILLLAITIVGIPWAVRQAVRWFFVSQAIMIDDTGVVGATDRSAEVVIGSWWRTFGIALVIGLIGAIPSAILYGVFYLAPVIVSGTASAIMTAVVLPFGVGAMTLLYFDLTVRKEAIEAGQTPA